MGCVLVVIIGEKFREFDLITHLFLLYIVGMSFLFRTNFLRGFVVTFREDNEANDIMFCAFTSSWIVKI